METSQQRAMLDEARQELAALDVRATHLRQLIEALSGLLGVSDSSAALRNFTVHLGSDERYPRPREAILRVLRNHPGQVMMPRVLYSEIDSLGLLNPTVGSGQAAYDQALRRLAEEPDSSVHKDDTSGGYYYYPNTFRVEKSDEQRATKSTSRSASEIELQRRRIESSKAEAEGVRLKYSKESSAPRAGREVL